MTMLIPPNNNKNYLERGNPQPVTIDSADSGCRGRRQREGWIKMNRLTRERANGIKTGCWSPEKKQDLVDRLAEYEMLGLEPKQIQELAKHRWNPIEERLPSDDRYILLSFANFSLPAVGRYEDGAFYLGDCDEQDTCVSNDLYVNAWMELPKPYRLEDAND